MSKNSKELNRFAPPDDSSASVAILAGGLSRRLGRDKSKLKMGSGTLLQLIRKTAQRTGCPVRVVRKDCVPRCGPLGGIITAFARGRAGWIAFLACDMPAVSEDWILRLLHTARRREEAVFTSAWGVLGFPFVLRRRDLETVRTHRRANRYSLRDLADSLGAFSLRVPASREGEFRNINTAEDWSAYLDSRGE